MKYKDGRELIGKYMNRKSCIAIYKAIGDKTYMIWEAVRSCFGKGYWKNEAPWMNAGRWRNGK